MNEEQEDHILSTERTIIPRRYAGFWMRFWAYSADLLIIYSINGILLSPLKFINNAEIGFWTVTGIVSVLTFYVYFLLMTKFFGQTVGKMIFGLRVIREDAAALKWSDLFFREVIGRILHRVFFFAFLLYVVVAFSPEKKGVHDRIGNTRVVYDE
ncbi:RDD family protein [Virgibacillus sp. C22-A2]|uniref:RDD family protein n=1 Tax=Virgibacillus tibetensis TaxID=3042313 RepID=A0ABU6KFD9_9BACI|nr:RDD family protein [Virgibacillus sp. C22-A2]